jgi:NAD(P)-dependent dehydrogenase (short-subunit alcohol dehydrogenase family)
MSTKLKPLAEQVIVITGASSGIGLTTARQAARAGAKVLLVARSGDALAEIVADIHAAGGEADYAVADVGDAAQVRAAAEKAVARWGRIDSWINDAGMVIYAKLVDTPEDEHRRLFETNYWGVVHGCLTAVEHLRERGGAIVTVGSVASDMPTPILSAYSASKFASKGFVESLRIELAADGLPISLSLVKPSGIDTPIGQHAANHAGPNGAPAGEALAPPPVYTPELVADAILYCCTHRKREITVGGFGRAEALFAQHFKGLYQRLAPLGIPLFTSPSRPQPPTNLWRGDVNAGRERSGERMPKPFSLYTSAAKRPLTTAVLVGGGLAGLVALRSARRLSTVLR